MIIYEWTDIKRNIRHFYYIDRKATRSSAKDPNVLAQELEEERKRNASLLAKLKKAKTSNKLLEKSMNERSFDNNSVLMASMSNLSFASLQVPECKPIDGEDEIDRKSYEQ